MPSKKPCIMIRTEKELIEKFSIIAEDECRSMSSLGEYLIKQYIRAYEAEHGEIKLPDQDEL